MYAMPTADGLTVIDCTDIICGNDDIVCERGTPNAVFERVPQCYPSQCDWEFGA